MVKNLLAIWETWFRSLGWEDTLEKGTATHSSILAWRIPWTEEPGGLQSIGSQRVRHEWATFTFTCLHIVSSSQNFLRPRCSASQLPLGSLRWGWRKNPLVLLPMELKSVPLTSLCNEGYLLQAIFLTQESNQILLHCGWILHQLSYQGSPQNNRNYSFHISWG